MNRRTLAVTFPCAALTVLAIGLPACGSATGQTTVTPITVEKRPVPDAAATAAAGRQVRTIFASDYASVGPRARASLAQRLLASANEAADDPVAVYALLIEARDLAIAAGHMDLARQALRALVDGYRVDALALELDALRRLAADKNVDRQRLVAAWLDVASQLLAADRADARELLIEARDAALRAAEETGLEAIVADARDETRRLERWLTAYEGVRGLLTVLRAEPDAAADHAAADHAAAGRFLCFLRGDFARGLPLLRRGDDEALRSLAERELASSTAPQAPVELADAWRDLAARRADDADLAAGALRRALHWTRAGLTSARGLDRLQLQRRAGDLERTLGLDVGPACVRFTAEAALRHVVLANGEWRLESGRLFGRSKTDGAVCTLRALFARIDRVTLRARIVPPDTTNLRLAIGPLEALLNWELAAENHFYYGREHVGTTSPHVLVPGREHEIVVQAAGGKIELLVDGKLHWSERGHLHGTVSVMPAVGSTIAIREIKVEGDIVPGVTVEVPWFLYSSR